MVYHVHLALKEFFNQKCWERNQIKVQINSLQQYTSNLAGGVPICRSILPRLFKTPQNIKPAPRIEGGGRGGGNSNGNGKFKRQNERDDLRNKKKAKVSRKCPLPEGIKAEIEKCITKSKTHAKKFVQMATLRELAGLQPGASNQEFNKCIGLTPADCGRQAMLGECTFPDCKKKHQKTTPFKLNEEKVKEICNKYMNLA